MKKSPFAYAIRYPSTVKTIISMIVIFTVLLMLNRSMGEENLVLSIFTMVWSVACIIIMGWAIYLAFKKSSELLLDGETLQLSGYRLKADQIKAIMILGDSESPVIGINQWENEWFPLRCVSGLRRAKGMGQRL